MKNLWISQANNMSDPIPLLAEINKEMDMRVRKVINKRVKIGNQKREREAIVSLMSFVFFT